MNKIKVSAVAKSINVPAKEVAATVGKYTGKSKNSQSSLDQAEMDIVLEYYTQKFDDGTSIEEYIAKARPKVEPAKPEPKPKKEEKPAGEAAPRKTRRYVDTRANVIDMEKQLAKEKAEALAPEIKDSVTGKQKIKKKNTSNQGSGRKNQRSREEELRHAPKKVRQEKVHVLIPDEISVGELASRMKASPAEIIKKLIVLGIMAAVTDTIDFDTASLVAEEMGAEVEHEVIVSAEEKLFNDIPDEEKDLVPRPPVVVVMGHVDHGKTSLLDAIRSTNVTSSEAGGITQHIGAYMVNINGNPITFLDTPGHEAFTAMRARGAQVTDIAILVVAADDGIMPQTVEAINHAKAANVSIIVAINKIDKEGANPDRVKQELTEHGLVPEEWGGDVICVEVSAKKKQNIDTLLEMVILTAEMKELKANPNRKAKGTVVEAKLDRGRGPVATVLVQNGTLCVGDIIVAGTTVGRVRAMADENGRRVKAATPSMPVEIVGLGDVPEGGDLFYAVSDERAARAVVEERKQKQKAKLQQAGNQPVTLENLFEHLKESDAKGLNIIVKADVQGSVEAVRQSLEKLSNDEVKVKVIHGGVGAITESDVTLASASNAIIVGFNVRPDAGGRIAAETNKVDMRMYRVIYEAIEEIEAAMKGMLAPTFRENVIGHVEIRQTFKVSGVGTIAGAYVTDGKIQRSCGVRIIRDGIVIHEGELSSLKRFKDDVKEVQFGYECGMAFDRFNDIKEGDTVECYVMEEVKR